MKATFVRFDQVNGVRLARFRLEVPSIAENPFPRFHLARLRIAPHLGWRCVFAVRVVGDLKEVLPIDRSPGGVDFEPVHSTRGDLVAELLARGIHLYYGIPEWWVTWRWRRRLGSSDVW